MASDQARVASATEQTLFPIPREVQWCIPGSLGGLDCDYHCGCDDGAEYYIKTKKKNALIPHSEWFCTRLGDFLGLVSPPCCTVRMSPGEEELAFGSRAEGGLVQPQQSTPNNYTDAWWIRVINKKIPLIQIKSILSRIYAFDHFVHNVDRHANNFLAREQKTSVALIAFDYSRAWLCHGTPLPALPFQPTDKTVVAQRQLAQLFQEKYIEESVATEFMERVRGTPTDEIAKIIASHPEEWLTKSHKDWIMSWWKSSEWSDRIDGIVKGIGDGTYL